MEENVVQEFPEYLTVPSHLFPPVRDALMIRIPSLDHRSLMLELLTSADMYYRWTEAALARMQFTRNEINLLLDVAGHLLVAPYTASFFTVEVDQALADGLADDWNVDGRALMAKMHGLNEMETGALSLALQNGHSAVRDHGHENIYAVLHSLGLATGASEDDDTEDQEAEL